MRQYKIHYIQKSTKLHLFYGSSHFLSDEGRGDQNILRTYRFSRSWSRTAVPRGADSCIESAGGSTYFSGLRRWTERPQNREEELG